MSIQKEAEGIMGWEGVVVQMEKGRMECVSREWEDEKGEDEEDEDECC